MCIHFFIVYIILCVFYYLIKPHWCNKPIALSAGGFVAEAQMTQKGRFDVFIVIYNNFVFLNCIFVYYYYYHQNYSILRRRSLYNVYLYLLHTHITLYYPLVYNCFLNSVSEIKNNIIIIQWEKNLCFCLLWYYCSTYYTSILCFRIWEGEKALNIIYCLKRFVYY